jgi:hypothetical protein
VKAAPDTSAAAVQSADVQHLKQLQLRTATTAVKAAPDTTAAADVQNSYRLTKDLRPNPVTVNGDKQLENNNSKESVMAVDRSREGSALSATSFDCPDCEQQFKFR